MDTQPQQETFFVITDINEPEEEGRVELFTFEDAVAICQFEEQDSPIKLEVREF
jgi:hypothetical protein